MWIHVTLPFCLPVNNIRCGPTRPEGGGVLLTRYGNGSWGEAHQAMAHPCQIVVRNATNVSAHLFRQVMWGSMWRLTRLHCIPRNSQIEDWRNANNAMWVYRQAIWVGTWKSSLGPPRKHSVVQGIMFNSKINPKTSPEPEKGHHKSQQ